MTHSVSLTDDELVVLDGRCRAEIQARVEVAKDRLVAVAAHPELAPALAALVADVVREAETAGVLEFRSLLIDRCPTCGRSDGFYLYPRTTRTHRKGDTDFSRPRRIAGVDLAKRSVVWSGSATLGCCETCYATVRPALLAALATVRAELPERLTGAPPRFKRFDNKKCTSCQWAGHEGQMKSLPAMMGGYYRGECPKCGAKNLPFGASIIQRAPGQTVVEVAVPAPLAVEASK